MCILTISSFFFFFFHTLVYLTKKPILLLFAVNRPSNVRLVDPILSAKGHVLFCFLPPSTLFAAFLKKHSLAGTIVCQRQRKSVRFAVLVQRNGYNTESVKSSEEKRKENVFLQETKTSKARTGRGGNRGTKALFGSTIKQRLRQREREKGQKKIAEL